MKLKDLIPILPQYNDGDDKGLVDHIVEVCYLNNYEITLLRGSELKRYNFQVDSLYDLMKLNSPLLDQEVEKIDLVSHYDDEIKIQIKLKL